MLHINAYHYFYYIIIKTPFYLLKINKETNKKYLSNALLLTYFSFFFDILLVFLFSSDML